MKILLITSEEFSPADRPLAGIFQKDQALALNNAGHDVVVCEGKVEFSLSGLIRKAFFGKNITAAYKHISVKKAWSLILQWILGKNEKINYGHRHGFDVISFSFIPFNNPDPGYALKFYQRTGMKALMGYFNKNPMPDIVHAHNVYWAAALANEFSAQTRVPYLITEHSSLVAKQALHKSLEAPCKKYYEEAGAVVVVSKSLKDAVKKYAERAKIEVLPNVLPLEFEKMAKNIQDSPLVTKRSTIAFVNVAGLLPVKAHDRLLQAFAIICHTNKNVSLTIIGDGPEKVKLHGIAKALKIEHAVEFKGSMTREEIAQILPEFDYFVFSSDVETFGVAALEALSLGLPVVSTPSGGPGFFINESNGIISEDFSPFSLAKAMQEAMTRQWDKKQISQKCIDQFGEKAFVQKIEKLYGSLINQNRK